MDTSKYTEHLTQVLLIAEEVAKRYNTTYIGSEHLVLGMLCVPDSTAGKILVEAGATLDKYTEIFKRAVRPDTPVVGYTPRTKSLLERSPLRRRDHPLLRDTSARNRSIRRFLCRREVCFSGLLLCLSRLCAEVFCPANRAFPRRRV